MLQRVSPIISTRFVSIHVNEFDVCSVNDDAFSGRDLFIVRDVLSDKDANDHRFQNGTKSKLMILSEKLQGFERQMEFHSKQRRMHEEQRFLSINDSLERLDDAISQESKRRMETIKALHGVCYSAYCMPMVSSVSASTLLRLMM